MKNNIKKLLTAAFLIMMCMALVSCGGGGDTSSDGPEIGAVGDVDIDDLCKYMSPEEMLWTVDFIRVDIASRLTEAGGYNSIIAYGTNDGFDTKYEYYESEDETSESWIGYDGLSYFDEYYGTCSHNIYTDVSIFYDPEAPACGLGWDLGTMVFEITDAEELADGNYAYYTYGEDVDGFTSIEGKYVLDPQTGLPVSYEEVYSYEDEGPFLTRKGTFTYDDPSGIELSPAKYFDKNGTVDLTIHYKGEEYSTQVIKGMDIGFNDPVDTGVLRYSIYTDEAETDLVTDQSWGAIGSFKEDTELYIESLWCETYPDIEPDDDWYDDVDPYIYDGDMDADYEYDSRYDINSDDYEGWYDDDSDEGYYDDSIGE